MNRHTIPAVEGKAREAQERGVQGERRVTGTTKQSKNDWLAEKKEEEEENRSIIFRLINANQ